MGEGREGEGLSSRVSGGEGGGTFKSQQRVGPTGPVKKEYQGGTSD